MKRKKNNKQSVKNYSQSILTIMKADRKKSFNHKQIAAKLKVNDASSRNQIIKNLHKLAGQKEIEEVERGKFQIINSKEYFTGKVDMASRGNAYIVSEAFEDDVFVTSNNMNKALHGDTVELYI